MHRLECVQGFDGFVPLVDSGILHKRLCKQNISCLRSLIPAETFMNREQRSQSKSFFQVSSLQAAIF